MLREKWILSGKYYFRNYPQNLSTLVKTIENIIQKHLIPSENFTYGFSDLTGLLHEKFAGFNYGISIGVRLDSEIVDRVINGPTPEYFAHYRKANNDLALLTWNITEELSRNNVESLAVTPTVATSDLDTIYFETLRTDLSHKMVATRAGLGWIGKTDLFISKEFGPRLRLVSILLKTPVKAKSKPIDKSRCGKCTICVDICPAKAANGKLWNIKVDRNEFYDPWKCRNQCAEFGRTKLGQDARVCGICVSSCPIGKTS
jgi:epoxyqueuosine reductase